MRCSMCGNIIDNEMNYCITCGEFIEPEDLEEGDEDEKENN